MSCAVFGVLLFAFPFPAAAHNGAVAIAVPVEGKLSNGNGKNEK